MVLAAGLGTRMRPLTLLRAKPVLPVLNRPLLGWTLERLSAAGVSEVVVNLHHLPATVVRAMRDDRSGLRITYSRERAILGTGGGPRKVRAYFGDEPFLLVNGDVLFDFDLGLLLERHRRAGVGVSLGLIPNPDPRHYGPVITDETGSVLSLAGLPRKARGRPWLFTGIHVLDPRLLERLPRGFSDSVRDLYAPLVADGERVLGVPLKGTWYDLGSPALYLAAQQALLRKKAVAGQGRSWFHPEAQIHPGARLECSVVGRGCVVGEGARVLGSVLWEGVRVRAGARIDNAILADGVSVATGESIQGMVVTKAGPRTTAGAGEIRAGRIFTELS
jgi:NDP-sugar pyrophosphorylase family protein